jgi:hypothetical protein
VARTPVDLPGVLRIPRSEFLDDYWDYEPGEHVTILGHTGNGKTYTAQQLLQRSAVPVNPALCLIAKRRDDTVKAWAKGVGYRTVTSYPTAATIWRPTKPAGYVLWPRWAKDPRIDKPNHERIFRTALLHAYAKGNHIVFADETVGLQRLGLTEEIEELLMQGRSLRAGMWCASQAPINVTTYAYSQSHHLFLGYANDKRHVDRFKEIGGVDTDLVAHTVKTLGFQEWLYIRKEDRVMCIVEKS